MWRWNASRKSGSVILHPVSARRVEGFALSEFYLVGWSVTQPAYNSLESSQPATIWWGGPLGRAPWGGALWARPTPGRPLVAALLLWAGWQPSVPPHPEFSRRGSSRFLTFSHSSPRGLRSSASPR
ncbi:hypothetical protein SBA4_800004 [Candidatus Sulfopaludibacter sp. SbA4]|nr:hypothetical protein SBA4_800004 [Candidatus Sulfopaludibacter sp. SbA4]